MLSVSKHLFETGGFFDAGLLHLDQRRVYFFRSVEKVDGDEERVVETLEKVAVLAEELALFEGENDHRWVQIFNLIL